MTRRERWARRWATTYGAGPGHLLTLAVCLAVAGYAATRVLAAGIWVGFLLWFVGAVILHDLVLLPLYSFADTAVQSRSRPPAPPPGTPPAGRWPPPVNFVRVPAALSGLLLLVWFPVILRASEHEYREATGLSTIPYLGRWLLVTVLFFAASGLLYALRLRAARRTSR
ncbi:hypothetical protein [Sphaerisporangium sp. TRM90804]|uniref:hypothetical protein n=1 Tax=Sphaerisporangium sp. TRM90804 TaxID=3031113 RepID=UPI00244C568B|nr:hypothetical protein [Sphaerisporangium sp. TRM90804]MDH2425595.1 hypothetical protein [Sphaerisporangium sp. TRM90804]